MLICHSNAIMGGTEKAKSVPPDSPVEIGEVIAGKYRVDSVIAVGGMGIVVAAEHRQLGQEFAIKVLLPTELAQEPHAATRFLREARAAARIRSDHVVRIFDVDTLPSGLPYMVMERLDGSDLRAILRSRGPLPVGDVARWVTQACDAVGHAHRMGIVHRDLKPSNLFLTQKHDGTDVVKVLDFGISKTVQQEALEGTLTTSRTLIGSPLYMSPEQIRDPKAVDARSDIWSFGIILHQLLTGKPAFTADSLPGVCAAIAADPPASLSERRPDLPAEVESIVQKCLEKRPDARYQSVEELCDALAPFVETSAPRSVSSRSFSRQVVLVGDGDSESPTVDHTPAPRAPAPASEQVSDAPLASTQREAGFEPPARKRLWLALVAGALALALVAGLIALFARPGEAPEPVRPPEPAAEPDRAPVATPSPPLAPPVASSAAPLPSASVTARRPAVRRPPKPPPAPATGGGTDIRLER